MINIRKANIDDLDFIVEIDLANEGISQETPYTCMLKSSELARKEHRRKMARFVEPLLNTGDSEWDNCKKYALIGLDGNSQRIGLIMFLIREMNNPAFQHFGVYDKFKRDIFPEDGRIGEIFQLWVNQEYRQQGIAMELMKKAENDIRHDGVCMIYSHTESINTHVVELHKNLGYIPIRTGTLSDEIVRISLVKNLGTLNQ